MRDIFFYISTAVFMTGFVLLVVFRLVFDSLTAFMYIVPVYLMFSGAATAALVSCFEPRRELQSHETQQLVRHETEEHDDFSDDSSFPTDATTV